MNVQQLITELEKMDGNLQVVFADYKPLLTIVGSTALNGCVVLSDEIDETNEEKEEQK